MVCNWDPLWLLAAVALGWLLAHTPPVLRGRRHRELDRQWENLFSYDGQHQEVQK